MERLGNILRFLILTLKHDSKKSLVETAPKKSLTEIAPEMGLMGVAQNEGLVEMASKKARFGVGSACARRNYEIRPLVALTSVLLMLTFLAISDAPTTQASSINMTVTSSPQSFDLLPTASGSVFGKSGATTVSVTTDYPSGYTLTIAGQNDTRILVGTNSSNTIESIGTSISESTFSSSSTYNNKWGYLPSKLDGSANSNYQPAPTTTSVMIDKTTTANASANTYTFAIAAKVDATVPKDTYSTTFTLAATGNATNYSIGYVDLTNNMPTTTAGSTTDASVTLSSITPTKAGYIFKGWCSVATTTSSCSGTTYQPGATYNLSNGEITNLYAIWEEVANTSCDGYLTMQNISSWKSQLSSTGSTLIVCDSRDYTLYTVGKLADGNIWMLQNLALVGSKTLTSADSNVSSNFTLPASGSWADSYDVAYINSDSMNTSDSYGKYGVYYNYCAASAGSNCATWGNGAFNPTQDICPKGWKLPTGGSSGQFQALYTAYSSNYTNFRNALKLPLSGDYYSSSADRQGSFGYFWSSTYYNGSHMYVLYLDSSSIYPQNGDYRSTGNSVRCVAQ